VAEGADGSSWGLEITPAACSAAISYNAYTPWLDVEGCKTIAVTFVELGDPAGPFFWHGVGIHDGKEWATQALVEPPPAWTLSGPHLFDVAGDDSVRVFFGYMGKNADAWRVDDLQVGCVEYMPEPTCAGQIDLATLRTFCQEGAVDVTLEGVTVTYAFNNGYFLQDDTAAIEVYVGPDWPYPAPAEGSVIDLHVTEYGSYANQQEVVVSDPPVVVGAADPTLLAIDISGGFLPGEESESFYIHGTGLKVTDIDGKDVTVAYGTAAAVILRVDTSAALCIGATFDLLDGVVTQYWDIHRLQVFDAAIDLGNINTDKCPAFNADMSNWNFEEPDLTDPPPDFEKATDSFTAFPTNTAAHGGAQSCELIWNSKSNQELYQGFYTPVVAGQKVTFSLWTLDNDPAGRLRLLIRFYDAAKNPISNTYSDQFTVDSPDWMQMVFAQTAPNNAAFARAYVRLYDTELWTGEAVANIDDWSVVVE
jgi:hypothetical protein